MRSALGKVLMSLWAWVLAHNTFPPLAFPCLWAKIHHPLGLVGSCSWPNFLSKRYKTVALNSMPPQLTKQSLSGQQKLCRVIRTIHPMQQWRTPVSVKIQNVHCFDSSGQRGITEHSSGAFVQYAIHSTSQVPRWHGVDSWAAGYLGGHIEPPRSFLSPACCRPKHAKFVAKRHSAFHHWWKPRYAIAS